jgi:hypothetical protein
MKLEFSDQIFEKYSNTKFHENPSKGSRVVPCERTDGRTDRHVKGTVRFPYLETCGVRKWGKTEREGGARYEDGSCFMAADITEQYQSQIYRPLQH